jgi:hypothetical protein
MGNRPEGLIAKVEEGEIELMGRHEEKPIVISGYCRCKHPPRDTIHPHNYMKTA